jgi:hypothetical protein
VEIRVVPKGRVFIHGKAGVIEAPNGTHAGKGDFAGMNDFEVIAFLVVLPGANA